MDDQASSLDLEHAAADPATPQATLGELAYAHEDLRPIIASNPSAYDGLLEWLAALGDPLVDAALAKRAAHTITQISIPAAVTPLSTVVIHGAKFSWPAFLTKRFVIVLASLVVLAIIATVIGVSVHNASVDAQLEADQAVTDFKQAVNWCAIANTGLSGAIADAATAINTDPSTLADPGVIDQVRTATPKDSAYPVCVAPAMAADTETIRAQTSTLKTSIGDVNTEAAKLKTVVDAVTASAQKKKDDAAAAAAAADATAAAAALAAAHEQSTWHYTSDDGHSFDVFLSAGSPETDDSWRYPPVGSDTCGLTTTCVTAKLVDVCSDFDASTMIAIPVTATFTATTQGFDTDIPIHLNTIVQGRYTGPNSNMGDYLNSYVEVGHVWSSGPLCVDPTSDNGGYSNNHKAGDSFIEKFVVILKKWKTPNTPGGDQALLDWVAISPGSLTLNNGASWTTTSSKVMTLSNKIVGQ